MISVYQLPLYPMHSGNPLELECQTTEAGVPLSNAFKERRRDKGGFSLHRDVQTGKNAKAKHRTPTFLVQARSTRAVETKADSLASTGTTGRRPEVGGLSFPGALKSSSASVSARIDGAQFVTQHVLS